MAARPPRRFGGSSNREVSSRSGSPCRSSGPMPEMDPGLEGFSRSAGVTGRCRPWGGDGRPRPRPLLGSRSRPANGSYRGSPAPSSAGRSLSLGPRTGGGGTRDPPRSRPWISPGPVGAAGAVGIRDRWVLLGGRSGSTGSTGRNPLPRGSASSSTWGSRSKTRSEVPPNLVSRSRCRVISWSQSGAGASVQAGAEGAGVCVSWGVRANSSATGGGGCTGAGGRGGRSLGSTKPSPNRRGGGSERSRRPRIDRSGRSRSRPRS